MKRTIVPDERYRSESLAPGLFLESMYPGGMKGPNHECDNEVMGGQAFTDVIYLGEEQDGFQIMFPDIRMPANQYWPLHWHDCWTVVLVVEGSCTIGDWTFMPGDIFLTIPSLEYGPMVIGPRGCRLFEIFAQAHLAAGGYSPEFADHPTLQGSFKLFFDRSELNSRNNGRQILPCSGVEGIWRLQLEPGLVLDMGDAGDPERGILRDVRLPAGEALPPATFHDWRMLLVMAGSATAAGRTLVKEDYLRIAPGVEAPAIVAGNEGVQILELIRTAKGIPAG